jgi:hypothetical protein
MGIVVFAELGRPEDVEDEVPDAVPQPVSERQALTVGLLAHLRSIVRALNIRAHHIGGPT